MTRLGIPLPESSCTHPMLVRHGDDFWCFFCRTKRAEPAPGDNRHKVFRPVDELPPTATVDEICARLVDDKRYTPEQCDFCSSRDVMAVFWCRPFELRSFISDLPIQAFDAGWAACAICAEIVERGDQRALTERSARRALGPSDRKRHDRALRRELALIHRTFFRYRITEVES